MTPCGGPAGVEADKIRTELGINYHMVRKESADPRLTVSRGPHCRIRIMKLTKKAAALLLAASLAVSVCATPVFAENPNMGSKNATISTPNGVEVGIGSTDVFYKVTQSYTWSVPATIDFGENAGVNNTSTVEAKLGGSTAKGDPAKKDTDNRWKGSAPKIMVTQNIIGVGKTLQINVDTTGGHGASVKNGRFYVEAPDTAKTKYETLYFTITKPVEDSTDPTQLGTNNNKVLSVPAGTNTGEQALEFKLETAQGDKAAEVAGDYVGAVVFYSEIV